MELNSRSPFTLFLILILLVLASPNSGTHVDSHLDYMVNSLQTVRNSIQTVRQSFQAFHAVLAGPTAGPTAQEPAPARQAANPPDLEQYA